MIEIDCDGHRSGVQPGSGDLLAIAQRLAAGGLTLKGVVTHAGNSYACKSAADIAAMARQERDAAVGCALALREQGYACPEVSVGSTPTAYFATDLTGVTEVRAGVFVFGDLVMNGLGVVAPQDIAVSVLASVIGHQKEKGWTIVDAGWMAMSRDRGTSRQRVDQGYGVVCDVDGALLEDIIMVDANQEHGVIAHRSRDPEKTPHFPVGTLLRILPNHACATCAQHDRYHVVAGGSSAIDAVWPRFQGW
jgi:D-serine deaminase-like pyridoxal phosphate-dependent protein